MAFTLPDCCKEGVYYDLDYPPYSVRVTQAEEGKLQVPICPSFHRISLHSAPLRCNGRTFGCTRFSFAFYLCKVDANRCMIWYALNVLVES